MIECLLFLVLEYVKKTPSTFVEGVFVLFVSAYAYDAEAGGCFVGFHAGDCLEFGDASLCFLAASVGCFVFTHYFSSSLCVGCFLVLCSVCYCARACGFYTFFRCGVGYFCVFGSPMLRKTRSFVCCCCCCKNT